MVRLLLAAIAVVAGLALVPDAAASTAVRHGCTASVPEPGSTAPVDICWTLFRPEGADAAHPVPLVMDGHGWAGSRAKDGRLFADFLRAGFGVLSFDQRGFGSSGGHAHWQHPDFEGQDVQRLVDFVAGIDWVQQDGPGDPRIGAIGGSYGGGYQLAGALTEIRDRGRTRFDALAPQITWWDTKGSLAPDGVLRTYWTSLLLRDGRDAMTPALRDALVVADATGTWSAELDALLEKNGPAWHVQQGRRLDVPVLLRQGHTDNLFNLNEGLRLFDELLTPAARARSTFIGFNGGHTGPTFVPLGLAGIDDPCTRALGGSTYFPMLARFFTQSLKGEPTGLGGHGRYHLTTAMDRCVTVDAVTPTRDVALGRVVAGSGPGAPVAWMVADGPLRIAGVPSVDAIVSSAGVDARLFFALSVGATPADARIVQNNMLPVRVPMPVTGERRHITLPAVAVDVPAGQSLFLTVSPFSDASFGHGSRTPGAVVLDDAVVHLPVR